LSRSPLIQCTHGCRFRYHGPKDLDRAHLSPRPIQCPRLAPILPSGVASKANKQQFQNQGFSRNVNSLFLSYCYGAAGKGRPNMCFSITSQRRARLGKKPPSADNSERPFRPDPAQTTEKKTECIRRKASAMSVPEVCCQAETGGPKGFDVAVVPLGLSHPQTAEKSSKRTPS